MMHLKILLPYKVFADIDDVAYLAVNTTNGSFGFLPRRLDCAAALLPGIITCTTAAHDVNYIATDAGILIKRGAEVTISVRNAVGGADLGALHDQVQKEFLHLDESEKNARTVLAKLESGFIHEFEKFRSS